MMHDSLPPSDRFALWLRTEDRARSSCLTKTYTFLPGAAPPRIDIFFQNKLLEKCAQLADFCLTRSLSGAILAFNESPKRPDKKVYFFVRRQQQVNSSFRGVNTQMIESNDKRHLQYCLTRYYRRRFSASIVLCMRCVAALFLFSKASPLGCVAEVGSGIVSKRIRGPSTHRLFWHSKAALHLAFLVIFGISKFVLYNSPQMCYHIFGSETSIVRRHDGPNSKSLLCIKTAPLSFSGPRKSGPFWPLSRSHWQESSPPPA